MRLKIFLLIAAVFGLTSCKQTFEGNLSVFQNMKLVTSGNQQANILAGNHKAKIKVVNSKKIELILNSSSGELKFPIKTNQSLNKVTDGTQLYFSSRENGQAYDVRALYRETVSNSPVQSAVESCVYYRTEYRCQDVYYPPQCTTYTDCSRGVCQPVQHCIPGRYARECGYANVPYHGYQDVSFYYVTTSASVSGDFINPNNNAKMASFGVSDQSSAKQYTFQGVCR